MTLALAIALATSNWTYWVEPCQRPTEMACTVRDADLAGWAMEAWARASAGAMRVELVAEEKKARVRFYWAGARPGLYGEARPIEFEGQRGAEIFLRPAIGQNSDALLRDVVLYMTCLHEAGHALGLGHTRDFDDIMYNFQYGGDLEEYFNRWRRKIKTRDDLRAMGGYSTADAAKLQRALAYLKAF